MKGLILVAMVVMLVAVGCSAPEVAAKPTWLEGYSAGLEVGRELGYAEGYAEANVTVWQEAEVWYTNRLVALFVGDDYHQYLPISERGADIIENSESHGRWLYFDDTWGHNSGGESTYYLHISHSSPWGKVTSLYDCPD